MAKFLVVLVGLLIVPSLLRAEEIGHNELTGEVAEENTRRLAENGLRNGEIDFLSKAFSLPPSYLKRVYSEALNKGVQLAAKEKNENEIGKTLGDMFGLLNPKQMQELIETTGKELAEIKEGNRKGDGFISPVLLDRIRTGLKFLMGKKMEFKTSEDKETHDKFFAALEPAYKEREEKNKLVKQKVKEALEGDTQATKDAARDWLNKNLNRESFLEFVEGQRKSGREDFADKLLKARADPDGSLDIMKGNTRGRLQLGSQLSKALKELNNRNQGLHDFSLAEGRHTPEMEWGFDKSGKWFANKVNTAQPNRDVSGGGGGGSGGSATSTGSGGSNTNNDADDAATVAIIKGFSANCMTCHPGGGFEGTSLSNLTFENGSAGKGTPGKKTAAQILNAIENVTNMKDLGKTTTLVNALKKWKAAQGG